MADNVSINSPIDVKSNSKERVAYDLMVTIGSNENSPEYKTRDYWLTLYRQCYKAANGANLEYVLKQD